MEVIVRDARDEDSAGVLSVIEDVFAEYPGCLYESSEMPELARPATSFAEMHGRLWVVERDARIVDRDARIVDRDARIVDRDARIVGCVGMAPDHDDPTLIELKKLYLRPEMRGTGMGRRLITLVEDEAIAREITRIHLWSDTRFTTAHRVYERCGYHLVAGTRELHDVSNSIEFHYAKQL